MLDSTQQNRVIAFLMARLGHAFEGGDAVTQPRAAADAGFEFVFPIGELIGCRAGEVLRQYSLRGSEYAQNKMPSPNEGVGAARIVANAPEYKRRIERYRSERIDGHALPLAAGRHRADQAN